MTSATRAIENYEKLSILTRELREAAVRGEWDHLTEVQRQRATVFDAMITIDSTTSLDEAASRRKDMLITQILADEAEIRERIKTQMAHMESELQEGRQELRLLREYRRHAV
jgi:flagellar protein FliT